MAGGLVIFVCMIISYIGLCFAFDSNESVGKDYDGE